MGDQEQSDDDGMDAARIDSEPEVEFHVVEHEENTEDTDEDR